MEKGSSMFANMDEVKAANQADGQHWFDGPTMAFFRCRIESQLIGGRWFISSEQSAEDAPRLYTVRAVASDGTVSTVGEFQAYETLADALMALGEHAATVHM
jgi:hypothetical protein